MTDVPLEAFVQTPSGQLVRIRLMGRGPAIVMLHESPRSGAALLPLAGMLANRFTCVMLDTPGFGLSAPLALSRPEIPDFADVAAEVIQALGLGAVPVYGVHTGAALAADLAWRRPDVTAHAVLDGYAMFTPAERDELLAAYLTPLRPSLDGTHVAWLWSRVRDQFTAFPWHRVADAGRLPVGPPPLERLQAVIEDFLLAGDNYRAAYAAAFRYDHLHPIRNAVAPVHVGCRTSDLLFGHLKHATGVPDHVSVGALAAEPEAWGAEMAELLGQHAGAPTSAADLLARLPVDRPPRRIVNTGTGPVVIRYDGSPDAPPVVLLHDVPGGMADLDHVAERLARTHRVVRMNLPGIAVSRGAAAADIASIRRELATAIGQIGKADAAVVAFGAALAAVEPSDRPLIVVDPWPFIADAAAGLPDLAPRWDGAHLFAAFYWARDYDLYKPWYHRVNAESRALGGERDMERLNHRFRAAVMGGPAGIDVTRSLYRADPAAAMANASQVLLYDTDPDCPALKDWAADCAPDAAVIETSRESGPLTEAIVRALA